jgi:hypothetical protein
MSCSWKPKHLQWQPSSLSLAPKPTTPDNPQGAGHGSRIIQGVVSVVGMVKSKQLGKPKAIYRRILQAGRDRQYRTRIAKQIIWDGKRNVFEAAVLPNHLIVTTIAKDSHNILANKGCELRQRFTEGYSLTIDAFLCQSGKFSEIVTKLGVDPWLDQAGHSINLEKPVARTQLHSTNSYYFPVFTGSIPSTFHRPAPSSVFKIEHNNTSVTRNEKVAGRGRRDDAHRFCLRVDNRVTRRQSSPELLPELANPPSSAASRPQNGIGCAIFSSACNRPGSNPGDDRRACRNRYSVNRSQ